MFEIVKLATKIMFFGPPNLKHWHMNKTKCIYLNILKFFKYILLKQFLLNEKKKKNCSNNFCKNKIYDDIFLLQFVIYAVSSLQLVIKSKLNLKQL